MSKSKNESLRFTSDLGVEFTMTGYRLEHGDWQDMENGDRPPDDGQWEFIDLVTINLKPDSEDGFYRSARLIGGFDADYWITDLADEMAHRYGFMPA